MDSLTTPQFHKDFSYPVSALTAGSVATLDAMILAEKGNYFITYHKHPNSLKSWAFQDDEANLTGAA